MADAKHPRKSGEGFKRRTRAVVREWRAGRGDPARVRSGAPHAATVVKGIRASGSTRAAGNGTPERNEPVELRKRNRHLEMEVDVLKQAAPVFARK